LATRSTAFRTINVHGLGRQASWHNIENQGNLPCAGTWLTLRFFRLGHFVASPPNGGSVPPHEERGRNSDLGTIRRSSRLDATQAGSMKAVGKGPASMTATIGRAVVHGIENTRVARPPHMLLSAMRTACSADRVRHRFESGFVSIDARVEALTGRRATQHQQTHGASQMDQSHPKWVRS
jgi:hypothetical protein